MDSLEHVKPRLRATIIGGGLAGLAAAVALADRGFALTILESRPRLGGRAGSFTDQVSGDLIDNCQHVSMACCTNLADFCKRVGGESLFRREKSMTFLSPEGKYSTLKPGILPAPFHLAESFLRANYLTFVEKMRVAYGLARLCSYRIKSDQEPLATWLKRHAQTDRTIERYWAPVLVSALNELPEQMDIGHAKKVFVDGFLRNKIGHQMEVPLVPLGELYGRRLETWLNNHKVDVKLNSSIRTIEKHDDGTFGVELRSGGKIDSDIVLIAVPFDRIRSLIAPRLLAEIPTLATIDQMAASPITGVHLWFDRDVCPHDHVVVIGHLVQWVFNHTAIQEPQSGKGGQYLQVVISASYNLLRSNKEEILQRVVDDLESIWPTTRAATLLRSRVVTEHGATFAVRPGVDQLRPTQRTPVPGLFLAGDWTETGWPATMEGAVRSGYLAAEQILADSGEPAQLLAPPLPQGWLARLLLGNQNN